MNRIALATLSLAIWSLTSTHVYAKDGLNGHDLSVRCGAAKEFASGKELPSSDFQLAASCVSLLQGFSFGWNVHQAYAERAGLKPFMICYPKGLSAYDATVQETNVIVKYLDDNPTESHEPWDVVFMRAFQQYYPCDK